MFYKFTAIYVCVMLTVVVYLLLDGLGVF